MPTLNPRVNVTLSPSLYELVGALAKHQRISKSMVLRELLEASEPALAQVVAMMQAAEGMSKAARERLGQDMDETIKSLEGKAEQAMSLAAGVTSDLVAQAESIRGRRPGGKTGRKRSAGGLSERHLAHGGSQRSPLRPPSSNRGVKSKAQATNKIASNPSPSTSEPRKTGVKNRGVKAS